MWQRWWQWIECLRGSYFEYRSYHTHQASRHISACDWDQTEQSLRCLSSFILWAVTHCSTPSYKTACLPKAGFCSTRHVAEGICLSFLLKDMVLASQTVFRRWDSAWVWSRLLPGRDLWPMAGLVQKSSDKDLGGHLHARAAPGDVLWLLVQPIICQHHPRQFQLPSACKSQQLRNQHTFTSSVSPPWWPFLAKATWTAGGGSFSNNSSLHCQGLSSVHRENSSKSCCMALQFCLWMK